MKLRFRRPRHAFLPAPARPGRTGRMRDLVHDAYQAELDEAFAAGYTAALDDAALTAATVTAALPGILGDAYSDRMAVTATNTAEAPDRDPADTREVSF